MHPAALPAPPLCTVTLDDGMTLTYRELGAGPPIVLLHGWPTSSYLWRAAMPALAREACVLAVDLPGFGGSDKPTDRRYTFDFFDRALTGFFDKLEVDEVGLVGHDIGGPIAVHWALTHPGRMTRLALLNTLLYPDFDPSVFDFVRELSTPDTRDRMTDPAGLTEIMRLGVAEESRLTDEALAATLAPFRDPPARLALAAAGIGLHPRGFVEIARFLPTVTVPVRLLYGELDRILPDVATTMTRVQRDIPHADLTAFPHRGHFLQEEIGEELGELLSEFFTRD